jgi:hypothetical protein
VSEQKLVRLTREDDYERRWIVVGERGAVDFHCSHLSVAKRIAESTGMLPWRSGGVEYHHRTPPDYMSDKDASHELCWILGGKCWHDGSSLWASEHWIPLLERSGEEAVWAELERTYARHFPVVEVSVGAAEDR